MPKNILFEVSPVDPSTGLTTPVRMSLKGGTSADVVLNGKQWLPVITAGPQRSVTLVSEGPVQVQEVQMDHGSIQFQCNSTYGNLNWANYAWDGATAQIWVGDRGAAFSSYTLIFTGSCGPIQRNGGIAQVALLGKEQVLDTPLLTASYAGNGAIEGPATLTGVSKPRCYGTCLNIQAVLVDPAYWIYQYHAYGTTQGVTMVYENAYPVNAVSQGDFATYSALQSATLAAGQWASCKALGLFRLGGQPNGKITADVQGALSSGNFIDKISTIVPDLLKVSGVLSAQINQTSFNTFSTKTISLYQTAQITVGEVARDLLRQAGGYLISDSSGNFRCGDFFGTRTPTLLRTRNSTSLGGTLIREQANGTGLKQLAEPAPLYKVRVGYDRVWSVNSDNEISSALLDSESNAASAVAAATAAQTAASTASANAATAIARLDNIASDNILDRSEKSLVLREYGRIVAEKSGIDSTGTAVGLTSAVTAYDSSYTTLTTYLNGLTPLYTDLTQDTTIDGPTFRTKFNDYYAARQSLLNSVAQYSALAAYLTKDTLSLTADSSGNVSSYANANCNFIVMQGNVNITEQCTFSSSNNIGTLVFTLSNTAGSRGQFILTGGPTTTSGQITLTATFGGTTFNKILNVVKAPAGAAGSPGSPGVSAITGLLNNESMTVAADNSGNVSDFSGAGGTFRVWNGLTEVTGTTGPVTYSAPTISTGLSISIASTGIYTVSALSVDQGTATLRAVYGGVTIDKIYTIAKSKAGAVGGTGATAKLITLICDRSTITYSTSDGTNYSLSPAVQPVNFTVFRQNTSNAVTWSIKDTSGNTVSNTFLTITGDTASMTAANFQTARGTANGLKITATVTDGSTLTDTVSVIMVQGGVPGVQGIQGIQGPTGLQGQTGNNGRDAMVFYQNSTVSPTTPTTGDTWYQPDTKRWYRWNGTSWVQLLGNMAQFDQINATSIAAGVIAANAIGANQLSANSVTATQIAAGSVDATKMNVGSISAISGTLGTFQSAASGQRTVITGSLIQVYDSANVLRVQLGIW